jgi:hypothetical protein
MNRFRFRNIDGNDMTPERWLRVWADRYPVDDYPEYANLIALHGYITKNGEICHSFGLECCCKLREVLYCALGHLARHHWVERRPERS